MITKLTFTALEGLPEVYPGDDLATLLGAGLMASDLKLADCDVLVVSQKIVSKSEGRYVDLDTIKPGAEANALALQCRKDPRLVELTLRESTHVVRIAPEVLIVRHRLGLVMANAGIDQSNVPGNERVLLLPVDPDGSANRLRTGIQRRLGVTVAVLISDSFGRAWRLGVCGVCIGCAGMTALLDQRGMLDRNHRPLQVTQLAIADQICATAALASGEAAEGRPMVVVRGIPHEHFTNPQAALALIRPIAFDLFS